MHRDLKGSNQFTILFCSGKCHLQSWSGTSVRGFQSRLHSIMNIWVVSWNSPRRAIYHFLTTTFIIITLPWYCYSAELFWNFGCFNTGRIWSVCIFNFFSTTCQEFHGWRPMERFDRSHLYARFLPIALRFMFRTRKCLKGSLLEWFYVFLLLFSGSGFHKWLFHWTVVNYTLSGTFLIRDVQIACFKLKSFLKDISGY